jgi:hypothetical protein
MMELLNNSRNLVDQANRATKHAQEVAAEALTAASEADDQHDHLRELVIKLQRSCKRSHSRCSSVESPTGPDPAMDQHANSVDEGHQLYNADPPEDIPAHENREPFSSSTVTPAWLSVILVSQFTLCTT